MYKRQDLQEEPDELQNHIEKRPKAAAKLARQLLAYGERTGDPYITNPKTLAAIESLV